MQTCLDSMHQTLQEKESTLLSLETMLQAAQKKTQQAEAAAAHSLSSAQQRHTAIKERARLAEQVCYHHCISPVIRTPAQASAAARPLQLHASGPALCLNTVLQCKTC